VSEHVDDVAMGVPNEEAPHAPGLVREGVHDLRALATAASCAASTSSTCTETLGTTGAVSSWVITLICISGQLGSARVTIQPWSITGWRPRIRP
jgi:hypothetical protein